MKTINRVFLILFISLAASPLFAQTDLSFGYRRPEAAIDTFGYEIKGAGRTNATFQSSDGGYITASQIESTRYLVTKMEGSGQRQWERTLDFTVDKLFPWITIAAITETIDHGFVLAGEAGCYFNDCEDDRPPGGALLIKLDSTGHVLWKKSIAVNGFDGNLFTSVVPMPDGGVIATGVLHLPGFTPPSRILAVRLTVSGNVVWNKSYRNSAKSANTEGIFSVQSVGTLDQKLIVAAPTINFTTNTNGLELMKINDSGLALWKQSFGGAGFTFASIGTTADNGVILAGLDLSGKLKIIVLKTDGTLSWQAAYLLKVPGRIFSLSNSVKTPDGGYVITGSSFLNEDVYGFIVKIDANQQIAFQNISGPGRTFDGPVFHTADGGFVLFGGGRVDGDIFVLKLNAQGHLPGCSFLHSVGTSPKLRFAPLKIVELKLFGSKNLTLEPVEFGMSSSVTNHQVSTLCQ